MNLGRNKPASVGLGGKMEYFKMIVNQKEGKVKPTKRKRTSVSKRVRFEILKRDSFKCQYCGASAPDSVLHVDHIKPVSKGGSNDIFNLITACDQCNMGKSNIEIPDNSALARQKAALDDIQSKRESLEMMSKWRDELKEFEDNNLQIMIDKIKDCAPSFRLGKEKIGIIKSWLRKYEVHHLESAIERSASQYLKTNGRSLPSYEKKMSFFRVIPTITERISGGEDDGNMEKIYYARGILRNRLSLFFEDQALDLLVMAFEACGDADMIVDYCKTTENWFHFQGKMHKIKREYRGEK